jgi:hypothetical protein
MSIVDYAKKFLMFVGSSIGGLTAIFYAIGFLSETSRSVFLGIPYFMLFSERYLYTGARFFSGLPSFFLQGISLLPEHPWLILRIGLLLALALLIRVQPERRPGVFIAYQILILAVMVSIVNGHRAIPGVALALPSRGLIYLSEQHIPEKITLRNHFHLYLVLYSLLLGLSVFLFRLRRRIRDSLDAVTSEGNPPTPSRPLKTGLLSIPHRLIRAFYPGFALFRFLHAPVGIVYMLLLLSLTVALPMFYGSRLVHNAFPRVEVTATTFQPDSSGAPFSTFILRSEKEAYFFLVKPEGDTRQRNQLWYIKKKDVESLRIMGHARIWPLKSTG